MKIKKYLNKILPKWIFKNYQRIVNIFLNSYYNFKFHFPSKKLIVIGITGTKGKTTTSYLVYEFLKNLGYKTSLLNSEFYAHQDKIQKNLTGNTMPGKGQLIKFLNESYTYGSQLAVLEASSEGLMYFRHFGIDFDIGVFLNIHPEHIDNHGSFENYKKDKRRLFQAVAFSKNIKVFNNEPFEKTIVVNLDDKQANYFSNFPVKIVSFALESQAMVKPVTWKVDKDGIYFNIWQHNFYSPLLGSFNLVNILGALATLVALKIPLNADNLEKIKQTLANVKTIPCRMEILKFGEITVIIDYAHTPESIQAVFESLPKIFNRPKRIISLIGSDGGLRDKWKRPIFGELCARYSDVIVVSNINPYDEDPWQIIKMITEGAKAYLQKWNLQKPIVEIPDRKEAIFWIAQNAQPGDLVISLVKGNEHYIRFADYSIEWNEKQVFEEAFNKIKNQKIDV